jgi:hypothetical protein
MHESVYLIRSREEAQFAGRRLERSFLPQVLQRLCFFVLSDQRVYIAVALSDHAAPELLIWVRRILSECGECCDTQITFAQLTREQQRFSEVYLGRGEAFLSDTEG